MYVILLAESEGSPVSFATESIALTQEVFSKAQDRCVLSVSVCVDVQAKCVSVSVCV